MNAAADSATEAFENTAWRFTDPSKRRRAVCKIAQTPREKPSDFAKLETLNKGKPLGQ